MSNRARTDPHTQPPYSDPSEPDEADHADTPETEPDPDFDRYEQL